MWRRILTVALLVLLFVAAEWLGVRIVLTWQAAQEVYGDLQAAQSLAGGGIEDVDVDQAVALLDATHSDLLALQAAARPFLRLAPYMGWVPEYGSDIEAAPMLLEVAVQLTAAGESAVEPLRPLLERSPGHPGGMTLLEEASVTLMQAGPHLREALTAVEQARDARAEVALEELNPRLQRWVERIDRYLPLAEHGLQGALLAPELLGAEGERRYLLLVQNEDELRATSQWAHGSHN